MIYPEIYIYIYFFDMILTLEGFLSDAWQESVSQHRGGVRPGKEPALHQPQLSGDPQGSGAGDPEQRGNGPRDVEGLRGEEAFFFFFYYLLFIDYLLILSKALG